MTWLDWLNIDTNNVPSWRSIKGLAGSPPPKADTRDRARRHGLVDRTEFYQARLIEIDNAVLSVARTPDVTGLAIPMAGADTGTLWQALDLLKGSFALGTEHVLTFQRTGMPEAERVTARVAGELTADVSHDAPGVILWSVPLLAADPRIYSDTLKTATYQPVAGGAGGLSFPLSFPLAFSADPSSALLNAENDGNFPTPPVWTITGPVTNPQIVDETTGESLFTINLSLLTGEELVIDVAGRDATINDTSRPDVIDASQSTWGELAVGTNVVRLLGTGMDVSAGTALSVSFRDARI